MRDHARTLIVGSGAAGNALAAALARLGDADVIVLDARADRGDRDVPTERFGAILASHPSPVMSRWVNDSLSTFADLAGEEPQVWQRTGSLEVATTEERLDLLRRRAEGLRAEGIEAEVLDPDGAAAHVLSLDPGAILGALHVPSDGVADRAAFAAALARRASAAGASFSSGIRVTGVQAQEGRVTGVVTDAGPIACERMVLASCRDSARIAALVGIDLPVYSVTRQIRLSGSIPTGTAFPVIRHPDAALTLRRRGDRLAAAGHRDKADWASATARLLPGLAGPLAELARADGSEGEAKVTTTPDGMPIAGLHGGLEGLWILAGARLAVIPALADALAARLCGVASSEDRSDRPRYRDPNRWYPFEAAPGVAAPRAAVIAAAAHDLVSLTMDELPPRSLRLSPFHRREEELGAAWTAVAGWEVPRRYGSTGEERSVEAEVAAVRERVGLIDRTAAAKFDVRGEDAADLVERVLGEAVDVPVGVLWEARVDGATTTWVTGVRKSPDLFRLVTDARSGPRLLALLRSHAGRSPDEDVVERTGSLFSIRVVGPRAEELVARASGIDASRQAFAPSTARYIGIGPVVPVWAHRLASSEGAGSDGWDLFGQFAMGEKAWDLLMSAGEDLGVSPVGTDAASILRVG